MKKFFTFLMAALVTFSMYAVTPAEMGKKVDPTGHAKSMTEKKLAHNKQVAKVLGLDKMERKAVPGVSQEAKFAPKAKAQSEEFTLNYDAFAGMMCYAEDEEWWIGLSCDDMTRSEYGHNLQLSWKAPADNPCGTFTTEDFLYDFTHLTTPYSFGSIHFEEVTMTLALEKVSANLERYTLDATLVDEEGNTYKVHAVHENIVAKGDVEVFIADGTMTKGSSEITFAGKNEDLDLKLVVMNSEVVGNYGTSMVDWEQTSIVYKGKAVTPITFKAEMSIGTHEEDGALAYMADINMLGNDTVQYHILVAAPLPEPTNTVEVVCKDLSVDDSWAMMFGSVDFYASNSEYSVRGGWQSPFADAGTFEAGIFLDDVNNNTITSLTATITVSLDDNNKWAIEGTMLGDDNVLYNLHLSWFVPEQTDTVVVAFENSAKAKYYTHVELSANDIQLYNENDKYSASINVANVELGGEFTEEYVSAYFTYLEVFDAESLNLAEIKNGKLYQVGDTTKLEADFATFEGVLYQVKLWYVAPTPTETVKVDIKDAEFIMDFDYNGVYNLVGYSADSLTTFVVTVYATSKDDVPGTFVNDGVFGKFGAEDGHYDFDASNSFIGKWNALEEMYDLYYIQKGQFTVVLDEEDNLTLTASVVCEDAIQYEVSLTSKYEEPHIDYDAEEGPVNRVYGEDAEVLVIDNSADFGLITLQITDAVEGDVTALYFVMSITDSVTVIPVGTYEISNSWLDGTVLASPGIEMYDDGWVVIPSYYAKYVDGYVDAPYYFFQEGTVVVNKDAEGKLTFEINAVNSCGIPVHIVYGKPATGVENINVNVEGLKKQVIDGQLYIIRDGKAFNVMGAQVK